MGIIDTLTAGFSVVNRRLWVVLIPVLLDLFLWQGPRLTATGPVKRFFDSYANLSSSSTELLGQVMSSSDGVDVATQIAQLGEDFGSVNFFNVLAWQAPSLIRGQLGNQPSGFLNFPAWDINRGVVLLGLAFVIVLAGLLIQSAFLSIIAQGVRSGESANQSLLRRIAVNWLKLVAFFALLLGAAIFLGMPLLIITQLLGLISPAITSVMSGLLVAMLLWAWLYSFFAISAMFVAQVNPLRAIWYSLGLVRRHFFSSLGLIILIFVISFGLTRIWEFAMGNPAGVTAAILGNAYIEAGLAAAIMIFFRDRFLLWQQVSQNVKPVGEKT